MRRSRFGDGPELPDNGDYADNTKYNEKYILPTNTSHDFGTSATYSAPAEQPGQVKMFDGRVSDSSRGPSLYANSAPMQSGVAQTVTAEAPMVFALRSDPTLYVYEYSNRLEFYRATPTGMVLCNVEYKKPR